MTSRNCLHGFKIAVIALAIIDLVWNIYKFISLTIDLREGEFILYPWQWKLFYCVRIIVAIFILLGVFKALTSLLIVSCILNGVVFGTLVFMVIMGINSMINCHRNLCRVSEGPCYNCFPNDRRSYYDYDYTKYWSFFVVFELVIVIIYALMSTKKPPRSHEHMRTTVPLRQTTVPMRTTV